MTFRLTALTDLAEMAFDTIIDVRSPSEYAEDHLPGAINLPALSDAERARVGTLYKQVSPFTARKLGAALVARNAAHHLETALFEMPGGWRPLIYCWRGGQRSGSISLILSEVGWRVARLEGGYKAWRRHVITCLHERAFPAPVILLDGNTGSAKTEVLGLLRQRGVQVLDLEGMANHRGSLFGGHGPQPSQRAFEGRLAVAIASLDPARPVVVEAESSRIGNCLLPPTLWRAMKAAPRIAISAPPAARADYLIRAYGDLVADPGRLAAIVESLRPFHPAARLADWQALVLRGAWRELAAELMLHHYDPRYNRHRARMGEGVTEVRVEALGPEAIVSLADRIAALAAATPEGS
ncbi:selenophosphate-dependent tRNA 2-selenouridine synthase [Haematobacter massiliensis]|uniref:tRNA 2-selenouridine synthase n=1 Tax=Haematobacter massiliensis TaxID=195105 RepID=A0A086Y2T7_9RHOB|nr:tRNA 2-selenouridine(34) synthase MnmH [Haematobacter massiliensis]KFI28587.1 tRNA 2-selenouridine synthase [Haematobacter massiliensis]OWJ74065.1 selenophosphate-dependent tRNA 2-selenouridine synthase [Haematobacter massiliensis]OWJ88526.1 selenophosphate-dependent tRNA 2-selenouridine synthase [Haematobacter massiliensis]QBJ26136.1 tRNA 2-selenouridine(34) synthase MnmH [Haematobacter massiliensis]